MNFSRAAGSGKQRSNKNEKDPGSLKTRDHFYPSRLFS